MKKSFLSILLFLPIFLFAQYLPQHEAIKMLTDIEKNNFPEADMVFITNEIISLDDNALGTDIVETYRKVLNKAGKENRKLYFGYDKDYSTLAVKEIKIFKSDSSVKVLEPDKILLEKDINTDYSNIYSYSRKLLTGSLPDLEIGDIVYTKSVRKIIKTPLDSYFADSFDIENYRKYIYKFKEINVPSSIKLYIYDINNKGFKYKKKIEKDNENIKYTFTAQNLPMIIYEPYMDKYTLIAHHLIITSIKNWETISRWYYNLVEKHLKTDKDIDDKVYELVKDKNDDEEKIKSLFYWVSKKIRYLGVDKEKDRPGFEPHDVTFTFHTRGGVCRDKAALLVAMLRKADIQADVILVSVGNILDKEAPVIWFNHAIVLTYDKNGKPKYFLDPTDENTKDFLPAYEEDCSYLVASKKGANLGLVPVLPPNKNKCIVKINNNIEGSNSYTTINFVLKGIFDNFIRNNFIRYTKQDFEQFFSDFVKKFNQSAELISFTHSDANDKNKNITFSVKLKTDNYIKKSKDYYIIPFEVTRLKKLSLSIFNYFILSVFNLNTRRYNFAMPFALSFDFSEKYNFDKEISQISMPMIENLNYLGFKTEYNYNKNKKSIDVNFYFESSKKHFKKEDYLKLKQKLASFTKYQSLYIIAKRRK